MSKDHNEAIARRLFEAWNGADPSLLDEIVAEDAIAHHEGMPPGRQAWKDAIAFYRGAFPDLQYTIEDVIATEDSVVVRWTARGTDTVGFMGLPPTGRRASAGGINIFRVKDGLMSEHWDEWDLAGLLTQLGAIPTASPV